jgi:hypothetical protein
MIREMELVFAVLKTNLHMVECASTAWQLVNLTPNLQC